MYSPGQLTHHNGKHTVSYMQCKHAFRKARYPIKQKVPDLRTDAAKQVSRSLNYGR